MDTQRLRCACGFDTACDQFLELPPPCFINLSGIACLRHPGGCCALVLYLPLGATSARILYSCSLTRWYPAVQCAPNGAHVHIRMMSALTHNVRAVPLSAFGSFAYGRHIYRCTLPPAITIALRLLLLFSGIVSSLGARYCTYLHGFRYITLTLITPKSPVHSTQ